MMFWADNILHGYKYCICGRKWSSFKIIDWKIFHEFLEIYLTPEGGEKTSVLKIRNGELISKKFEISNLDWQHLKIEVYGGDISIIGKIRDASNKRRQMPNHFNIDCPFAEEDDWEMIGKKILMTIPKDKNEKISQTLESLALTTNEFKENQNESRKSMIRKRIEDGIIFIASIENEYNEKNNKLKIGDMLINFRELLEHLKEEYLDNMEAYGVARDRYLPLFMYVYSIINQVKLLHNKESSIK